MPTSEEAAKLAAEVKELGDAVRSLADRTRVQDTTIKRQKWFLGLISGSLAADLLLSFFVIWTGISVVDNQQEIAELQAAQRTQTEVNRDAQCAVMGLFFQSEQSIANSPNRTQQQKDDAAVWFAEMRVIAEDLGCSP